MSQLAVEVFLGRLITDASFNAKAASSLEIACRDEGLIISAEEMSYLKTIDFTLIGGIAETINDALKRG
jgi:hypothetical protein